MLYIYPVKGQACSVWAWRPCITHDDTFIFLIKIQIEQRITNEQIRKPKKKRTNFSRYHKPSWTTCWIIVVPEEKGQRRGLPWLLPPCPPNQKRSGSTRVYGVLLPDIIRKFTLLSSKKDSSHQPHGRVKLYFIF